MNDNPYKVPKGYKYPTLSPLKEKKLKPLGKPGGRHGTSSAQRSASRRNIRKAIMTRHARRLQ